MGDIADGWHTVLPTSHAGMSRLPQTQLEECERQILKEWEESRHHWSGMYAVSLGKMTSCHEMRADSKQRQTCSPRFDRVRKAA
jgi:hypothetical protein